MQGIAGWNGERTKGGGSRIVSSFILAPPGASALADLAGESGLAGGATAAREAVQTWAGSTAASGTSCVHRAAGVAQLDLRRRVVRSSRPRPRSPTTPGSGTALTMGELGIPPRGNAGSPVLGG